MTEPKSIEHRRQAAYDALNRRGQTHLLQWWDELTPEQRVDLLGDIESIPWNLVDGLMTTHVRNKPTGDTPDSIGPPEVMPLQPGPDRQELYQRARLRGETLIRDGKVAAFTVAGGQGTRLGHDGPKGTLEVTPVGHRTLFQLFADSIRATSEHFDTVIPWYIMTSAANHTQTLEYFESNDYLGLRREDVIFFEQGMLPLFGFDGRVLLSSKHRVALGPDGHGGSLKAMAACGALEDMQARGVEIISYFQVDNPLVRPVDPLFIGLHAETQSEASTKVTRKVDETERVGNVCCCDGKVQVIEYSDFPPELAQQKNADGCLTFDAANLAIHLFNVDFVLRIVGTPTNSAGESFRLPFRRAEKAVPYIDKTGALQQPTDPNAVKLEMFVFDALPLAKNPLVLEVDRSEEFSPVKNATGTDSLETSQRDQIARACKWLTSAGVTVPCHTDGSPDVTVIIAPNFALDAESVQGKRDALPCLRSGDAMFLE